MQIDICLLLLVMHADLHLVASSVEFSFESPAIFVRVKFLTQINFPVTRIVAGVYTT